ncbi:MAG: TonB-dependent receptor SusC [Candidatus Ordinivivax streblomastigis]|uniref:TonB-dependent receptor SusC n=1 Tax=Candidatus Ordinivivax streblomastigis TaxID=2540710 RepID=A0A5M8NWA6_9BACT|nr:MAG: TonB-dependent receptor SusC [Candidatus Ordinivivax streblomastigis]
MKRERKEHTTRVKTFLLALTGLLLSCGMFAQSGGDISVKGNVKDPSGESIIGASIFVKGTTSTGTITDFNGNFHLNAPANATLVVSYVGYTTKEIPVNNQTNLNIILQENAELLSEVVVIGYGTVKKGDLTGSVTAIKPDEISKGITISAQDMIMGKIAGVNVTSNNGTPGGGATIRVRGGSSLSASNDPLIVIDGLAMDNDGVKGLPNALALVNPNDIETFTVLKDASATAIYGSRASNGVIIITTKKGTSGAKPKVSYSGNVSAGNIRAKLEVLTGDEYREYITNLYGAGNLPHELGNANTDWQDEIYRMALSQDHNVTVSGGWKNVPYRVSIGYTNQNGILKTSNFERYTASVNLSPSLFDNHLIFNINTKVMYAENQYADGGVVGAATVMDPTRPVRDNTSFKEFAGYWQWTVDSEFNDPNWLLTKNALAPQNPVAALELKDDHAKSTSLIGNVEMDYKFHFFPDVRIHANLGGDYSEGSQTTINSPYSYANHYFGWNGVSEEYKYNLSGNAYLQYTKEFSSQFLDLMAGAEQQHFHRTWHNYGQGTNLLTGEAKDKNDVRGGRHNSLVSYFGRLNYTLVDKYLMTATVRQDGTSRFSDTNGNRWGTFPSVALGWRLKEEAVFKEINTLSDLKLRLGWGITGQQNVSDSDFPYLPQYVDNQNGAYYYFGNERIPITRPNAYNNSLKWEETTTWNGGLDFGFLNGRIAGSVDYYFRETKDLLNTVRIAAGTNFNTQMLSNIGSLENQGVEFSINAKPIVTKELLWDVSYNVTYNKNEITKLTGGSDENYYVATGGVSHGTGSNIQAHKVGYPASSFFVYQQVYDSNGKPIENLFVDRNGDGIINDSDRYMYKKPAADISMGLTSKILWKNWDFSFALRANINNYVYNDVLADRSDVSATGMWSTSGFYSSRPVDAINLGFRGIGDYYMSDYFVQNASFIRCDNITVGYSFASLLKGEAYKGVGGRIYATLQNPFVLTKYTGLDPELNNGIDNNIYPRPMTFLLGVNLQF